MASVTGVPCASGTWTSCGGAGIPGEKGHRCHPVAHGPSVTGMGTPKAPDTTSGAAERGVTRWAPEITATLRMHRGGGQAAHCGPCVLQKGRGHGMEAQQRQDSNQRERRGFSPPDDVPRGGRRGNQGTRKHGTKGRSPDRGSWLIPWEPLDHSDHRPLLGIAGRVPEQGHPDEAAP